MIIIDRSSLTRLLDRCWTYWATRVVLFCPWTRATTLLITFRIQVAPWFPEGIWSASPNCLHLAHTCLLNLISVKWTGEETMTTGAGTRQQVGNNTLTLVRSSSYWTKQVVLFSPCTPATTLNSQYKNVHWIKTVFYSIHFLAVRWGLIYTVNSGLSGVYSILQYPFIRCTYMPYLTLWDKISQNLAHLEGNSHKKFWSHRIFRPFYNRFYEVININHTLLWSSQASHMKKEDLRLYCGKTKVMFKKISQIFVKSPLVFCLISQILVHSLWHEWVYCDIWSGSTPLNWGLSVQNFSINDILQYPVIRCKVVSDLGLHC